MSNYKVRQWPLPATTENEIFILNEGYSTSYSDNVSKANCSSTLIKAPNNVNIIIDTMTAWDGTRLCKELDKYNVTTDDISHVICTHGHADHVGCNYLFKSAEIHFIGTCGHHRNKFFDISFKENQYSSGHSICDGVKILHTPGHTSECVSVIVKGKFLGKENVIVAITGDLFEKEEDIIDEKLWMDCGTPNLRLKQAESRYFLIWQVNFIIPGHGRYFPVTEEKKSLVLVQLEKQLDQTPKTDLNSILEALSN